MVPVEVESEKPEETMIIGKRKTDASESQQRVTPSKRRKVVSLSSSDDDVDHGLGTGDHSKLQIHPKSSQTC